ncbi:hypothetical protein [Sorangium sp. So ce1389]|uniref:hypothetical protein n=1 Tax=Sorangium sp. So ce1389 TaxID=3133336 RepID=UPI003F6042D9
MSAINEPSLDAIKSTSAIISHWHALLMRAIIRLRVRRADAMTESEMLRKAIRHFAGWCERHGRVASQPSRDLSEVSEGQVILRNVRGELARYVLDEKHNRMRPRSLGSPAA